MDILTQVDSNRIEFEKLLNLTNAFEKEPFDGNDWDEAEHWKENEPINK